MGSKPFHIIFERDNGLFSLILQVITHVLWAQREDRIPIVYFGKNCCYWHPEGYQNKDNVWEYYFEPLIKGYPVSIIPDYIKENIDQSDFKNINLYSKYDYSLEFKIAENFWASNNYGEHRLLKNKTIHFEHNAFDLRHKIRKISSHIINTYIRPRDYIQEKVDYFFNHNMKDKYVLGVHIRGTDTQSECEGRTYKKLAFNLKWYIKKIQSHLKSHPEAIIFVASDAEKSIKCIENEFGDRVISYDSLRHSEGGEVAGKGPMGGLIPGYIANDSNAAVRNGEEAIIEYLLLSKCQYFIHNGSSLAKTVLLKNHELEHVSSLKNKRWWLYISYYSLRFYRYFPYKKLYFLYKKLKIFIVTC